MTDRPGHMNLLAMLTNGGHHLTAWRHPKGQAGTGLDIKNYAQFAKMAEKGLLDALFIADVAALWGKDLDALSRTSRGEHYEPLTLLSYLAGVTTHIGLIGTATTSYNEPYHIARKFSSLDHLSGGRAGWNVVTSVVGDEARNFGRSEHFLHSERYERAEEFVDVVRKLWQSWADGAVVKDAVNGKYFLIEKVNAIHHKGKHFSVQGPLNISRTPQGEPVLVQAGASTSGKRLASRIAEIIFAPHDEINAARLYYAEIKSSAQALGRSENSIRILPGITPIVGKTRQEARDFFEQLQELVDPVLGRRLLADTLGDDIDLSPYDVDGPLPDIPQGNKGSRRDFALALAQEKQLSIRQLYLHLSERNAVVGTAADIADRFEEWYDSYAADGFNLFFPHDPGGIEDFVEHVVPELQKRGRFKTSYAGTTLRSHFGFDIP
ncbi:LLM class flavin-dependent oxidoreductase [Acetobacter tropicalis]|uniref:Pristinamycin IIA synthase subunit A n=1 Tax=Acetobacter tropicalis TaxID=104102 RepID=A0A252AA69_9PROT|nr:LLM class flavin-dependent oxidoreductase [Acetobacter tropicalis]OUI86454.1 pristinamycin IIA synthase subunit A [Acetobacter tropicalis]